MSIPLIKWECKGKTNFLFNKFVHNNLLLIQVLAFFCDFQVKTTGTAKIKKAPGYAGAFTEYF
jgi:hypothetical protein